ncbi:MULTISPECIES: dipeptidase [Paenibacillus]|uniref:dipeptidase n=1 Tax=Paenibacillus TaxID=44249 RepID=UPI00040847CC|nr:MULTISPECIES: dipeptidase [Paenibacillus]KKC46692.1 hypothetical protein VE23_05460 [Paenibacillus sp. D9]
MKHPVLGVADLHCDVLSKLLSHPELDVCQAAGGSGSRQLDVTLDRQLAAGYMLQAYAIYLTESRPKTFDAVLRSIDLFYEKIVSNDAYRFVASRQDLERSLAERRIAALLTLEGADGLEGDFAMLRIARRLGVRLLGLTWNYGNWAADGVMEERQGGLTEKGRQLIRHCNELGIILDVSHLTETGFWELADRTERPFIASHSNAKSVCAHPRNLTDDQIRALIAMGGRIGMTYVPYFVSSAEQVHIDDILRHIEHICALGGEKHIMLGSDFDGIELYVEGLRHPGDVRSLRSALVSEFGARQAAAFMNGNAISFLLSELPGD